MKETMEMNDAMSAVELIHHLPALIEQFTALRKDMERKSKRYESLFNGFDALKSSPTQIATGTAQMSFDTMNSKNVRDSLYTPSSRLQSSSRSEPMTGEDLPAFDDTQYRNTMGSRQSAMTRSKEQNTCRQPVIRSQTCSSYSMNNMSMGSMELQQYTVMWVCGECGISLRNFSRNGNKVGAQIAVLQHANGVTTGISKCRLGDQLVSIDDERVDTLQFSEIVEKLKTTRRPISLSFRTNGNMQTSPRAAASRKCRSTPAGSRSSHFFSRDRPWQSEKMKKTLAVSVADQLLASEGSSTSVDELFDGDASGDLVHQTIDHCGYRDLKSELLRSSSGEATTFDRSTVTSAQSLSWTLSDDVETWCREQEEMHSNIILLLTETIMRCEKLQQENLDQLQTVMQDLMQLSASNPYNSGHSDKTSFGADAEEASKVEKQPDVVGADTVVFASVANPRRREGKLVGQYVLDS